MTVTTKHVNLGRTRLDIVFCGQLLPSIYLEPLPLPITFLTQSIRKALKNTVCVSWKSFMSISQLCGAMYGNVHRFSSLLDPMGLDPMGLDPIGRCLKLILSLYWPYLGLMLVVKFLVS